MSTKDRISDREKCDWVYASEGEGAWMIQRELLKREEEWERVCACVCGGGKRERELKKEWMSMNK